jgi:hypothetical protein
MGYILSKAALAAALCLVSLTACSGGEESGRKAAEAQERRFSEEDKRAARALSIGDSRAIEGSDSPYAQALLCNHAVQSIADRLRSAGSLNAEQLRGFDQTRAYYERQLLGRGKLEGKSASQIQKDRQKTAAANPDPVANARLAIACLQMLQ